VVGVGQEASPLQRYANAARAFAPGDSRREENDFYPTPPAVTRALLEVEDFDGPIWECACGDGAMSKQLSAAGHEVVSTDLIDRGFGKGRIDFLMEYEPLAPNIVTNPPFKLALPFVRHALQLVERYPTSGRRKVVMFLRLAWLEGLKRKQLFESTPIARVHVFANRITFKKAERAKKAEGGVIAFALFVWELGHVGPPTLHWLTADHKGDE
jgi:hypothetical protein